MTPTRRLAAIMAADVAGFSAAMERDEEGTFAQVQELRRKIIEPKIAEHQGRLIKTTGDGFLAEFASPDSGDAVCTGDPSANWRVHLFNFASASILVMSSLRRAETFTERASTSRRGWRRWLIPAAS